MIFHSSLHKQRLWNLLKRFQFDEKQHLIYIVHYYWITTFTGILAPSVASLGIDQPEIPFLIFGIATLIGGISAYLLPETKGKKLPDSIQEALNMEDVKMPSSGPENDLCCTQA